MQVARPAFRKPWQDGAKAYHEADSLAALAVGVKRKRSPLTVLIYHSTHALDGEPCAACGKDLAGPYLDGSDHVDSYAMADVNPRAGTVMLRHYYCAWGVTMQNVVKLREFVS